MPCVYNNICACMRGKCINSKSDGKFVTGNRFSNSDFRHDAKILAATCSFRLGLFEQFFTAHAQFRSNFTCTGV